MHALVQYQTLTSSRVYGTLFDFLDVNPIARATKKPKLGNALEKLKNALNGYLKTDPSNTEIIKALQHVEDSALTTPGSGNVTNGDQKIQILYEILERITSVAMKKYKDIDPKVLAMELRVVECIRIAQDNYATVIHSDDKEVPGANSVRCAERAGDILMCVCMSPEFLDISPTASKLHKKEIQDAVSLLKHSLMLSSIVEENTPFKLRQSAAFLSLFYIKHAFSKINDSDPSIFSVYGKKTLKMVELVTKFRCSALNSYSDLSLFTSEEANSSYHTRSSILLNIFEATILIHTLKKTLRSQNSGKVAYKHLMSYLEPAAKDMGSAFFATEIDSIPYADIHTILHHTGSLLEMIVPRDFLGNVNAYYLVHRTLISVKRAMDIIDNEGPLDSDVWDGKDSMLPLFPFEKPKGLRVTHIQSQVDRIAREVQAYSHELTNGTVPMNESGRKSLSASNGADHMSPQGAPTAQTYSQERKRKVYGFRNHQTGSASTVSKDSHTSTDGKIRYSSRDIESRSKTKKDAVIDPEHHEHITDHIPTATYSNQRDSVTVNMGSQFVESHRQDLTDATNAECDEDPANKNSKSSNSKFKTVISTILSALLAILKFPILVITAILRFVCPCLFAKVQTNTSEEAQTLIEGLPCESPDSNMKEEKADSPSTCLTHGHVAPADENEIAHHRKIRG